VHRFKTFGIFGFKKTATLKSQPGSLKIIETGTTR